MPRQARIDIPGHFYHVIARGIEGRKIFTDEHDYEDFLSRFEKALDKTGNKCFAFSLLENHFHLLIMRGRRPLAELMRRLMTGYAVKFNRRHKRIGHLFQNRYKAILCDVDSYLLELVAYIHLNPLRAGIVKDLKALRGYKWCGHSVLVGENAATFLAKEDILRQFGNYRRGAIKKYESYLAERVNKFKPGELSGGGLVRSMEGLSGMNDSLRNQEKEIFDDRILGSRDFVASILEEIDGKRNEKVSLEDVMKHVVKETEVRPEDIFRKSQVRQVVKARALYCYLAKERCGVNGAQLMKQLRLTSGAISHLIYKGREFYNTLSLSL